MKNLNNIVIHNFETLTGRHFTIELSYQVFGRPLHTAPIVLVNHALTGNSNVTGSQGWWNDLIGEDKTINTKTFTILAFNIPGNGYDGKEVNIIEDYRAFVAKDIAKIFAIGLSRLNIQRLFAIIGGSVGGGIAWELAALKPNIAEHLIPIASDWKSTDWLIANCHIQDAILNNSIKPLEDARMHAMSLYRTPESLTKKFNRSTQDESQFQVESWLSHHGKKLNGRFEVSAYKMMNQILRTIDITDSSRGFLNIANAISSNIHLVTINSDLFFKPEENWNTYVELKLVKSNVYIHEIKSIHGHDAFLIEYHQLAKILKPIFKHEESFQQKLKCEETVTRRTA